MSSYSAASQDIWSSRRDGRGSPAHIPSSHVLKKSTYTTHWVPTSTYLLDGAFPESEIANSASWWIPLPHTDRGRDFRCMFHPARKAFFGFSHWR